MGRFTPSREMIGWMKSGQTYSRILPLTLLVLCAGCSRSALDKVVVAGNVSYDGAPVQNGEIMFYPMTGTHGPMSGASIKDGHYEANGKGGVPVGSHRVVIRGFRSAAVAGKAAMTAASVGVEGGIREQYIPKKFNSESTLEVKIDGNESSANHDFDLAK